MFTVMVFALFSFQDAGSQAVAAAPAVVDPGVDVQKFMDTVVNAVQSGNWQAVAAMALVFCVFLLRKYASKLHGKAGAWLNTDRGGSALVMVAGMACATATAALAGQKVSVKLLLTGLTTGAMASGLRNVVWDLLFPSDKQQPSSGLVSLDPPKPPPPPAA